MKNKKIKDFFFSLTVYLLAGALFVLAPTQPTRTEAAVKTESITGTVPVGGAYAFWVPRYMTMPENIGNGASGKLTGWLNPNDIWKFSMGLRNSGGTQFARWETAYVHNYTTAYPFLKSNGNGNLPRGLFYINAKVSTVPANSQPTKTFYVDLKYTVL